MRKNMKVYSIYQGDEFVDMGTLDELAERRGIKLSSLQFMMRPAYKRRQKQHKDLGSRIEIVEVTD